MAKQKGPKNEAYEKAAQEFEDFVKEAYDEPIDYKYSSPIVNILFWIGATIGTVYLFKGIALLIECINYKYPMGFF